MSSAENHDLVDLVLGHPPVTHSLNSPESLALRVEGLQVEHYWLSSGERSVTLRRSWLVSDALVVGPPLEVELNIALGALERLTAPDTLGIHLAVLVDLWPEVCGLAGNPPVPAVASDPGPCTGQW